MAGILHWHLLTFLDSVTMFYTGEMAGFPNPPYQWKMTQSACYIILRAKDLVPHPRLGSDLYCTLCLGIRNSLRRKKEHSSSIYHTQCSFAKDFSQRKLRYKWVLRTSSGAEIQPFHCWVVCVEQGSTPLGLWFLAIK